MAAIAGHRVIPERTRSVTERNEEKRQRSHSPLRGLLIAVPVGTAMWAVIIWVLRLVIF